MVLLELAELEDPVPAQPYSNTAATTSIVHRMPNRMESRMYILSPRTVPLTMFEPVGPTDALAHEVIATVLTRFRMGAVLARV